MSMIAEIIIAEKNQEYTEDLHIIPNESFGFRKQYSAEYQVL